MCSIRCGSRNNTEPPWWRLTVGAGQPKLMSIFLAPYFNASWALSAIFSASEPKICTVQSIPAKVWALCSNSDTNLIHIPRPCTVWVTRTNSLTHASNPPIRVNTSRITSSTKPCIGARIKRIHSSLLIARHFTRYDSPRPTLFRILQ